MNETIKALIDELSSFKEVSTQPFPYADCGKLTKGLGKPFDNFTADLNTYDMSISAPIDWGDKILDWSAERILRFLNYTELSFFDRFPQYKPLEKLITKTNTYDLYMDIQVYENIRVIVHKLLIELLK